MRLTQYMCLLSLLHSLVAGGCGAPAIQVGSAELPAVRVEPINLQVGPTTKPAFVIESGAVSVSVTTPQIPERPLWAGIVVVAVLAVIAYPLQRWIRLRIFPKVEEVNK